MVEDLKTLQDLAYSEPRLGPVSALNDSIRSNVKAVGKGLWQGVLAAAATGFGKGVLLAAALLVAGTAVYFGASAAGGTLFHTVSTTGAWIPSTLEQGIAHGICAPISCPFCRRAASALCAAAPLFRNTR